MKKKTYSVSYLTSNAEIPFIRLTGKWLIEKGFNVGDKLELLESKNMLILTKKKSAALEVFNMLQNKNYR